MGEESLIRKQSEIIHAINDLGVAPVVKPGETSDQGAIYAPRIGRKGIAAENRGQNLFTGASGMNCGSVQWSGRKGRREKALESRIRDLEAHTTKLIKKPAKGQTLQRDHRGGKPAIGREAEGARRAIEGKILLPYRYLT